MNIIPWKAKKEDDAPARFEDDFGPLQSLRSEMNRVIERFFSEPWSMAAKGGWEWNPSLDIEETEDSILVTAEVPGVEPEKLDVSVCGRTLTISGEKSESNERKSADSFFSERRFGSFRRTVQLPSETTDEVSAEHKNGVLKITLKKSQASPSRKITITAH